MPVTNAASETLAKLLADANVMHIPTNAGWTSILVGGNVAQLPTYQTVNPDLTAGNSALLHCMVGGLGRQTFWSRVNWDKKLYWFFNYWRLLTQAAAIARVQLKTTTGIGDLAARGIGLYIANMSLYGESFGTSREVVDLGVTLVENAVGIMIIHNPSVPEIKWYVDTGAGLVLKGTQSTAAKIPSGEGANHTRMVHSCEDPTGGVAPASNMGMPIIWQER